MRAFKLRSIGREAAIDLFNTKWWKGKDARFVAIFQLTTDELCMPFDRFAECVEESLRRPVQTIEFGLMRHELIHELAPDGVIPTFDEILNLVKA